jgi:hypothetical protein
MYGEGGTSRYSYQITRSRRIYSSSEHLIAIMSVSSINACELMVTTVLFR